MPIDRLLGLVKEFQKQAEIACSELRTHLKLEEPMLWRQSGTPRSGCIGLNDEFEYEFHGTDCRFKWAGGEIDFDFGFDGRVDGFDEWKLWRFSRNGTLEYPEFRDENFLRSTVQAASKAGYIGKPYEAEQDSLWYVVA
jgi:hypothetical protein